MRFLKNRNFIYFVPGFSLDQLGSPYAAHSPTPTSHIITPEESQAAADKIMGRTSPLPPPGPQKGTGLGALFTSKINGGTPDMTPLGTMKPDPNAPQAPKEGFWQGAAGTAMSIAGGKTPSAEDSAAALSPLNEAAKTAVSSGKELLSKIPMAQNVYKGASAIGLKPTIDKAGATIDQGIAGQSADNGKASVDQIFGGVDKLGQAINPASNLNAGQRITRAAAGATDIGQGGLNTYYGPAGAAIKEIPGANEATQAVMGTLHQGAKGVSDFAINKLGIDPNSEAGQTVSKAVDLLSQLGFMKVAHETTNALGNQSAIDTASKSLDDAKATGDMGNIDKATTDYEKATSAQAPSAVGNVGAGMLKAATDSVKGITDKVGGLFSKSDDVTKVNPNQMLLERAARQARIPNNDIAALRNLTPQQETVAEQYLNHSIKAADDPINTKSVWNLPAKEISDFRDKANEQRSIIGQNEENAINTDFKGKTVDGTPVIDAFKKSLNSMNIDIDNNGNLKFAPSDISINKPIQTALKTIWENIKQNRTITENLDESLKGTQLDSRGLISINRTINAAVKASEKAGLSGNELAAKLSPIKDAVEIAVKPVSPLYVTAKAEYADIVKNINKIDDAGKFGNKTNKGFSGEQILKRTLNTDSAKAESAFDAMKQIEENHGIKAPTDLKTKAYLANFMERLTNNEAPRSLAKQAVSAKAMDVGLDKMGTVGAIVKGSKNILIDANYKYFSGKIPGFKDAFEKANTAHTDAVMNLIKAQDFRDLPPRVKLNILKNVGSSIPTTILAKIASTPLPTSTTPPKIINTP